METFVVRIWLPATDGKPRPAEWSRLHGYMEHVATATSSAFNGIDELEALLLAAVRRDHEVGAPPVQPAELPR